MSFFEKLKDATIGFSGYARLARDPRGGFGYIALLLAIVVAINGYINMVQIRPVIAEFARQMTTWPDFGVRNGQFYFEGPMPFKRTAADGTTLLIDTTGQTTPAELSGQRVVLITRERYYMIQPGAPAQEFEFARLQSDVNRDQLQQFLASRPERLLTVIYFFVYLFQLAFKALDAAILGLIALLYGRFARRQVSFGLGFRLGLYAMTLPIIIQWIWPNFRTWSTAGFTVWWSLASIYLLLGLRAYWASDTPDGPLQG